MPIRDLAVTLLVALAVPLILKRPWFGVLAWSWISYMNPHKLCWGFAYYMPYAQVVAIAMFISLVYNLEPRRPPVTGLTVLWWTFIAWMGITTLFALYPSLAEPQFIKIIKIQLVTMITLAVMQTRERVHLLVWIIFLSIGFFGFKGGIFTLLTAGSHRVWGPEGFIQDNNHLAVAMLMILPLGYYLYLEHKDKWIRVGIVSTVVLNMVSVVGSWSRGAFLAIIATSLYMWMKSKNKVVIGSALIPLLPVLFLMMPGAWWERMESIGEYEKDQSAMGRLNSWQYAINVASDRFTGAGLESWTFESFATWAPNPSYVRAAHSIYFSVIADHGWIGFGMWFLIYLIAFLQAGKLARLAVNHAELAWMSNLARMIQVSLVAYATGGAFLSLAYFDLPWHLVSIVVLLKFIHGSDPAKVKEDDPLAIRLFNWRRQETEPKPPLPAARPMRR